MLIATASLLYRSDWTSSHSPIDAQDMTLSNESSTTVAEIETPSAREEPIESAEAPKASGVGNVVNCFSESQLESHPLFADEQARLDALAVTGPTMASYRGLSYAELESMVVQKDSAAMAVLGAISVMRARRMSDDDAVPYLLSEDKQLNAFSFTRPLADEVLKDYEEARDRFYEAALHGRLLSLQKVGEITWIIEGGPVELGWIEKDSYEALSTKEKNALDPMQVYQALLMEIAPQLESGPFGDLMSEFIPHSDLQQALIADLAERFYRDLERAGLPEIEVSESSAPSLRELRSMLCRPDGVSQAR